MCLNSKHAYGSGSLHTLKLSLTAVYQSTAQACAQAFVAKRVSSGWQCNVRGHRAWWTEADLPWPC